MTTCESLKSFGQIKHANKQRGDGIKKSSQSDLRNSYLVNPYSTSFCQMTEVYANKRCPKATNHQKSTEKGGPHLAELRAQH